MKKINQYTIRGIIKILSNTRIGGNENLLQIGAADSLCLKDPRTETPYLPGSSLKGKMRSSLEKLEGNFSGPENNKPSTDGIIARVFGPHGNDKKFGPTRIRVHDAHVVTGWNLDSKGSTAIDRKTGSAMRGSLRTDEFILPGAEFSLQIDLDVYDIDKDAEYTDADGNKVKGYAALIALVDHGLDELVNTGIGAGTGKGYGKIDIGKTIVELVKRRPRLQFPDADTDQTSGAAT